MAVLANTFREKLDAGEPTIGTHFLFNDPDIAELTSATPAEPVRLRRVRRRVLHLRHEAALPPRPRGAMRRSVAPDDQARPGQPDVLGAGRKLGAGFKAMLYTDIRTPEDVDLAMQAIRPDNGRQGTLLAELGGHMGVKTRRPALAGYAAGELRRGPRRHRHRDHDRKASRPRRHRRHPRAGRGNSALI